MVDYFVWPALVLVVVLVVVLVKEILLQVQLEPPAQQRQRYCLGQNISIDSSVPIP